jgi:hypothetical protein
MMMENYEDKNRWLVNISDSSEGGRGYIVQQKLLRNEKGEA